MEHLTILLEQLESKRKNFSGDYYIPEVWNTIGYKVKKPVGAEVSEAREGQMNINPYDFMISSIRYIFENREVAPAHNGIRSDNKDRPHKNVIYSILPRMFTAWDHYHNGNIYPGTFLKTICLLPYLKTMQTNLLYLLPVFEYSNVYKKGGLGSPYAIKNFYKLDPSLHDDLLGEFQDKVLELEFKAFVEACHLLGMKVMLDFVFRTVSRDNDLIFEHPDWFYWIGMNNSRSFLPPPVEKEKALALLDDKRIKSLYTCRGIKEYLADFTYSPAELDPAKWQRILRLHQTTRNNILGLIEENYQITTAPGFSNVINDPQPAWTDVTYLKFYYDGNPKTKQYVPKDQPPYVLQDIACLNLYPGNQPNRELWDYILRVIPYYQDKYQIDGARIDMGHALPPELNKEIMTLAKHKNPDFIFWSEEFSPEKSEAAKEEGFDFISGNLWSLYNDIEKPIFYKKLTQAIENAKLPVTAALEMADTPRLSHLYNEPKKISLLVLLNFLMVNALPFINNGMELLERQPMNLGLNNDQSGRFVLEKEDPMYGKLAFFDDYCLHWLNPKQEWMRSLLDEALTLRERFSDLIGERANLISGDRVIKNSKILFFCYYHQQTQRNLFFLANKHFGKRARVRLNALFPEEIQKKYQAVTWVYNTEKGKDIKSRLNQCRFLEPGEVLIGCLA